DHLLILHTVHQLSRVVTPSHHYALPTSLQKARALLVGEMSAAAADALLQRPRIGALEEHLHVVVHLQDQGIEVAEGADDTGGDRWEEETSEVQSHLNLVFTLLHETIKVK